MDLIIPTISQGLLWSLLAIGVYITFRVLDIADLTVEGSFPLGAATAAACLVAGWSPIPAMLAAAFAGMLGGIITGILCTKLKIPALLAGILTMIALYSVNLRIMGKANISLLQVDTVFSLYAISGLELSQMILVIGLIAVIITAVGCYLFFGTEIGAAIRATGCNPHMIRANGFADVGMGVGTIVIGLASVIIGEVLFGTRSFKNCLLSVILGSIAYRAVIAIVLQMGMPPNDLKLFTAILVAAALSMPLFQAKLNKRKAAKD